MMPALSSGESKFSAGLQPPLAYQALQEEINLGLLLPCNAVVYERDGQVSVGVVDTAKIPADSVARWTVSKVLPQRDRPIRLPRCPASASASV